VGLILVAIVVVERILPVSGSTTTWVPLGVATARRSWRSFGEVSGAGTTCGSTSTFPTQTHETLKRLSNVFPQDVVISLSTFVRFNVWWQKQKRNRVHSYLGLQDEWFSCVLHHCHCSVDLPVLFVGREKV
jgi:hypothetical protein